MDATANFSERRRRAAKLRRFFGVGSQAMTPLVPLPESQCPPVPEHKSPMDEPAAVTAEVDVKIIVPTSFWNLSNPGGTLKVVDVADVTKKMRYLKASH